jgi:hypothetical protein
MIFDLQYIFSRLVVGELFAKTTHDFPYTDQNVTVKAVAYIKGRDYFSTNFDVDAE